MKRGVGTTLSGLLVVAVVGAAAAALHGYQAAPPRPLWPVARRDDWVRRTPLLDDQNDQYDQEAPGVLEALQERQVPQVLEKRGFGSMMPAYLLQLYRPDQPLINPSLLFSRPSGRGKGPYAAQG